MKRRIDRLVTGCRLATMCVDLPGEYGAIDDAAVLIDAGRILWAGKRGDAPSADPITTENLDGRWITPGLIDCHTHLVFGGNRADEFALRANGASYAEISAAGGGIASTVRATRGLDVDALVRAARPRLRALRKDGVTTVEIKSGYALDLEGELNMLRAARRLGIEEGIRVRTTYLGLHALPSEYAGRTDDYVDQVIDVILPAIAAQGLADAVDAYVESIAFNRDQAARFFDAAAALGLRAKLHADQLSDAGGTRLAADTKALSADHLEYAEDDALATLATAGVVAVLLPGAYLTLREARPPPVAALRRHKVDIAVATDCNPGTSPMTSMLLAMGLACTLFRLTPAEALAGTTRNAARALGLELELGTISSGLAADLAVWDIASPAELSYWLGYSQLHCAYVAGRPAHPTGTENVADN